MHELAITQSVISIVESEAGKRGFKRTVSICLAVGEVSGFIPDCIREFFPIAAAGTAAGGAELKIKTLPARISCLSCGYEGKPEGAVCPSCGSEAIRLVAGREFYVDSIEVE